MLAGACTYFDTNKPPTDIPPPTLLPSRGTIIGTIWSDSCDNWAETDLPPERCVVNGGDPTFIGNGILEEHEAPIRGVKITLGEGECPSEESKITSSGIGGEFVFPKLESGVYCLTARTRLDKDFVWTSPAVLVDSNRNSIDVFLGKEQLVKRINFGLDFIEEPPQPTSTPTPIASPTPTPLPCTNAATFVRDITIPDGTRLDLGQNFTKVWRLQNSGTCTWNLDYDVILVSGNDLSGSIVSPIPQVVDPGDLIDIRLSLQAPQEEGDYEGYWMLRSDDGKTFGVGDENNGPFWVNIQVGSGSDPDFPDWRGEYYSNKNLEGEPAFLKNDRRLDKTWGLRSPNNDYLPRDNFSVRWTREHKFDEKTYRFYMDITDGGKLYIDDVLIVSEWFDSERRTVIVDVALEKGTHELKFEYYNAYGGAVAQLWYEALKDADYEGWEAKYWMNKTFSSDLVFIRDEAEINFDWGEDGPVPGGRADNFSAQWKRDVDFEAGLYTLKAMADDGIRVYVDGLLMLDEWHNSAGNDIYTAQLKLSGQHEIIVQYYEDAGKAKVKFEWELIEPENHAPEAVDDSYSVVKDEVLDVPAPGLLANDVDLDGDKLMLTIKNAPNNGTLELHVDGSFVYTPEEGFSGEDSFGYEVSDGKAVSNTATVQITVEQINLAPVAKNDFYSLEEDEIIRITGLGLLSNDSDPENDDLEAILEEEPEYGNLQLTKQGTFTYEPNPNFNGTDGFTYRVSDGHSLSNLAEVTLAIEAGDDTPNAVEDAVTTVRNKPVLIDVLVNDDGLGDKPLVLSIEIEPDRGETEIEGGRIRYSPEQDFLGDVEFIYRVTDSNDDASSATVIVTIAEVEMKQ